MKEPNLFRGFTAILYKEFIQIRRDKLTLFLLFVIPLIQLTIFGYAINTVIQDIATAVYDRSSTQESRELVQKFVHTGTFQVVREAHSERELSELIVAGKVKVGIAIPTDYAENLQSHRPSQVLVLIDGSDSTVASQAVMAATAVGLFTSRSLRAGQPQELIEVRPHLLFNPDSRSANFIIPGLIAVILQVTTTLLTAFSIVREREKGTLEQLLVTPIQPFGLMLGKLLPYMLIGFTEGLSVLTAMHFLFRVPIHGSLPLLLSLFLLFLFPALALGLLISTRAENQTQAMQLAYFIILPSVLLSGFMFPRESMPLLMNWLGYLIPATYFIDIMRGIVLRGASFQDLLPDILPLFALGLLLFIFSVRRFKKKIG